MWYVILSIVILVVTWLVVTRGGDLENKAIGAVAVFPIGAIVLAAIGYPLLRFTTGFYPDYATGQREGYVTKMSEKGIFFKTNEGQLQVGTGQMAALQEPWSFSIPDALVPQIQAALGKRVNIEYTQFLMMPWRYGETDYLVTKVTAIE